MIAAPALSAAKLALYSAMWRQGITRRCSPDLGISESAVGKLLIPGRYSHIKQAAIKQAAKALDAVGCPLGGGRLGGVGRRDGYAAGKLR